MVVNAIINAVFLRKKTAKKSLCELHKIPAKNSIDIELVFSKPFCGIFAEKLATFFNEKLVTISYWIFPHINPGKKFFGLSAFYGRNLRSPISKWDPIRHLATVSFLFLYEVPVVP